MKEDETAPRRAETPQTEGRLMTTGGDTSDERCEDLDMSPCSGRLMTTGGDTSDGRCEDHDMSPCSGCLMMTGGDTSDKRCEDHDMSPYSDRLMTTDGDTSDRRPPHDNGRRHLRGRCGPRCEPKFKPPHDDERRHLRRRCGGHDRSPDLDRCMTTSGDTSGEDAAAMKEQRACAGSGNELTLVKVPLLKKMAATYSHVQLLENEEEKPPFLL
ncbi:hypothetical protein D5086_018185 [Populus alba]|uniref:Uncharacterized protein n=1 Tax=Populus alba TaxID=43335 RepID=A0ACC4BPN1_POPAL